MTPGDQTPTERSLAEQVAYYRAIAPEYHLGRLELPGGEELEAALDALAPFGHLLELACGPGTWTGRLLERALSVLAVDASPEMLGLAEVRVGGGNIRFLQADLFDWEPPRRFDTVFFGFWLSHVPAQRFEQFFALLERCLQPDGRIVFVDDGYRTADELVEGEQSEMIERRTGAGGRYRIVKVPHDPDELAEQLQDLGWDVTVRGTAGPFYVGWGAPRERSA